MYLLHDVFNQTVKIKPDNIAIISESGQSITYIELNKLANKFANYFKNIKSNCKLMPFIGILSSVNIYSIAAVLGTLKIGCAYIPLDDQSPVDRLEKIIKNCKLDILVIDSNLYEKYKPQLDITHIKRFVLLSPEESYTHTKITSFLELNQYPENEPDHINQVSDDLAYVLHTSGSTGTPKGIMLTHRNARTFVDWMQKEFQLSENDKVMSRAPFKFDLSIFDIFNTFKAGATLICYDWYRHRNNYHKAYVDLMVKEKATILYTTPSTFISLMNHGHLNENQKNLSLRTIMYAGEPFQIPQLKRLKKILPNTKIANIYGPTETNIITYFWINDIADEWNAIPLGKEVDDTEIIIVSEDGDHLCEANEIGEIWCRGGTVTLGYLDMDAKTNKCKVISPFHPYPVTYWRTGDFGYRDSNNLLNYKGRKDHMVKIKGYRVEIGEVETALAQFSNLDEYVITLYKDEKSTNHLCCYYSAISEVTIDELKKHLERKIPEYMIPDKFIQLLNLPKTSSGKIDRVALTERAFYE